MSTFIAIYVVIGAMCFITSCVVTLFATLEGYPEKAKGAARLALGSLVWPIALPGALIYIALGGFSDKQKA